MIYKEFKNGNIRLYNLNAFVGTIHLVDKDQPGAYILSLWIKEKYQSKGYGYQLLDFAINKARESGCSAVSLYVDVNNSGAIRFYKQSGFFIALTTRPKNKLKAHYLMARSLL